MKIKYKHRNKNDDNIENKNVSSTEEEKEKEDNEKKKNEEIRKMAALRRRKLSLLSEKINKKEEIRKIAKKSKLAKGIHYDELIDVVEIEEYGYFETDDDEISTQSEKNELVYTSDSEDTEEEEEKEEKDEKEVKEVNTKTKTTEDETETEKKTEEKEDDNLLKEEIYRKCIKGASSLQNELLNILPSKQSEEEMKHTNDTFYMDLTKEESMNSIDGMGSRRIEQLEILSEQMGVKHKEIEQLNKTRDMKLKRFKKRTILENDSDENRLSENSSQNKKEDHMQIENKTIPNNDICVLDKKEDSSDEQNFNKKEKEKKSIKEAHMLLYSEEEDLDEPDESPYNNVDLETSSNDDIILKRKNKEKEFQRKISEMSSKSQSFKKKRGSNDKHVGKIQDILRRPKKKRIRCDDQYEEEFIDDFVEYESSASEGYSSCGNSKGDKKKRFAKDETLMYIQLYNERLAETDELSSFMFSPLNSRKYFRLYIEFIILALLSPNFTYDHNEYKVPENIHTVVKNLKQKHPEVHDFFMLRTVVERNQKKKNDKDGNNGKNELKKGKKKHRLRKIAHDASSESSDCKKEEEEEEDDYDDNDNDGEEDEDEDETYKNEISKSVEEDEEDGLANSEENNTYHSFSSLKNAAFNFIKRKKKKKKKKVLDESQKENDDTDDYEMEFDYKGVDVDVDIDGNDDEEKDDSNDDDVYVDNENIQKNDKSDFFREYTFNNSHKKEDIKEFSKKMKGYEYFNKYKKSFCADASNVENENARYKKNMGMFKKFLDNDMVENLLDEEMKTVYWFLKNKIHMGNYEYLKMMCQISKDASHTLYQRSAWKFEEILNTKRKSQFESFLDKSEFQNVISNYANVYIICSENRLNSFCELCKKRVNSLCSLVFLKPFYNSLDLKNNYFFNFMRVNKFDWMGHLYFTDFINSDKEMKNLKRKKQEDKEQMNQIRKENAKYVVASKMNRPCNNIFFKDPDQQQQQQQHQNAMNRIKKNLTVIDNFLANGGKCKNKYVVNILPNDDNIITLDSEKALHKDEKSIGFIENHETYVEKKEISMERRSHCLEGAAVMEVETCMENICNNYHKYTHEYLKRDIFVVKMGLDCALKIYQWHLFHSYKFFLTTYIYKKIKMLYLENNHIFKYPLIVAYVWSKKIYKTLYKNFEAFSNMKIRRIMEGTNYIK